jgi:class 3 adenylate cyclase/tetratricopeptide (TPR) repeat protein
LSVGCPSCGASNAPSAKFCGECGTQLQATAAGGTTAGAKTIARPAPAAERRLVTVLFADLVGFTTLSESRDAEEVRELLTRYFDTSRTLIVRYGGTVEKFIGDAVMAVWGTPTAREDDAERAVRASLDLVGAVSELGAEVGAPELRARAGVLTGEAAVTIGAEGQGMVAGDLVNTASRIQSLAQPGTALVGETTRRATEASVVYEEAGTHELKGKAEPVPLWRATRVVAARRGALKSTGLEAPFVGRARELRLIKDLFHSSTEERKAHLISVVGVAGLGKSRLSWELFKYLDGLAGTWLWHRGRCLSYGEGVTYWALADMVRTRAGIEEGEDSASAFAKLRRTIGEYLPNPEEQRWVEPRLAHLLGLEDWTARDREDLFAAWRLFFERLAEKSPTVLVFEDMQWADAALLDFIEYLLDWSKNHALFVMALGRPELFERHPSWAAGKRNLTSIFLEPLSDQAMDELLRGLVPGLPEAIHAKVRERAEGVPLYAVETVRMMIDRGLLVREGNKYQPARPIEDLEVPETLQALIAARLDGLAAEERRLTQDAAVLGKNFSKQAIVALSGLAEEELDPLLASLARKEVIWLQTDPRSSERGQYAFLQDLVRRVAYDTLSKRDRKARHLLAASYLEQASAAGEEELVEVVAYHYLDAYRAAPDAPDAGEIKGKAQDTLARAGERAASLAASEEGQHYFEQAAAMADAPAVKARFLERAGHMAWLRAQAEEAEALLGESIALFESEGMTHPAARVTARLAEVQWRTRRMEEGLERMERAFTILSGDEPDEDLATLAAQLGRLHFFTGDVDRAAPRIETALTIAESLALPEVLSEAFQTRGLVALSRARTEEALAYMKHALQIAVDHDISSAALRAYNNVGEILNSRDRYEAALDVYRPGLALAQKVGDRWYETSLIAETVFTLVRLGRWDEALDMSSQVPDLGAGDSRTMSLWQALVEIYLHRGKLAEAPQLLSMHSGAETSPDVQDRALSAAVRAMVALAEGDAARSLRLADEALRSREQLGPGSQGVRAGFVVALESAFALGNQAKVEELLEIVRSMPPGVLPPVLKAQLERFNARVAAVRGEVQAVESGLIAAAGMFRELGVVFSLAVTLLEYGEWLVRQGRREEAEPLLEEARMVFERLQATPWLDRLGRATGHLVAASG